MLQTRPVCHECDALYLLYLNFFEVQKNRRKKVSYTLPSFERDTLVWSRKSTIFLKKFWDRIISPQVQGAPLGAAPDGSEGRDRSRDQRPSLNMRSRIINMAFFRKLVIVVLKWISNDCARKNHSDPDKSRTCAMNKNGCFIQSRAQTTRDMLMWTTIVI